MFYAVAAAVGALLAYFFDRQNGARRRSVAGGWVGARAGRVARHGAESKDFDDVTLAQKVQSEIFRPDDAPKGTVDVNVEAGVVFLRGEVERPELIEELVARTREVQGVREVESLLHLPGEPVPTRD